MELISIGFFVGHYFVIVLAWIMAYLRHSVISLLPWVRRGEESYMMDVVADPAPIPGVFSTDGSSVLSYVQYPATGLVDENVGCTAFTWFLVWLCVFEGVDLTGRVVNFTTGLPIIITVIINGLSVSLGNAGEGVKLYLARWRHGQLAQPQVWQTARGQLFFSTGVGFGYFTSHASYTQNKLMRSWTPSLSPTVMHCSRRSPPLRSLMLLGFFDAVTTLGSFTVGFLTPPQAIVELSGANFWTTLLFFTRLVPGFSASFAMLDAIVALVTDAGVKYPRSIKKNPPNPKLFLPRTLRSS